MYEVRSIVRRTGISGAPRRSDPARRRHRRRQRGPVGHRAYCAEWLRGPRCGSYGVARQRRRNELGRLRPGLKLRNASSAQAALRAVSKPGSSRYHHYLTTAEWIAKYSPTNASVKAAKAWLKQQGFSVGAVAKDRLFVSAEGTAAQVEKAFSTSLGYYQVNGKNVRLANSPLSIPSSLGGFVSGVVGVNQNIATPSLTNGASAPSTARHNRAGTPPAGRLPQPAAVLVVLGSEDRHDDNPSLYAPFKSPQAYDICG